MTKTRLLYQKERLTKHKELGLRGGRKAGPLRMGHRGCWRGAAEGERLVLEGLRRLRGQEVETCTSGLGSKPGL